jgi:hypothetical protein
VHLSVEYLQAVIADQRILRERVGNALAQLLVLPAHVANLVQTTLQRVEIHVLV